MESSRYLDNESLFEKRMFILNLEEKESTTWKLKKNISRKLMLLRDREEKITGESGGTGKGWP